MHAHPQSMHLSGASRKGRARTNARLSAVPCGEGTCRRREAGWPLWGAATHAVPGSPVGAGVGAVGRGRAAGSEGG
eukprot:362250-Chlamydomonas_euryale.AAC.1